MQIIGIATQTVNEGVWYAHPGFADHLSPGIGLSHEEAVKNLILTMKACLSACERQPSLWDVAFIPQSARRVTFGIIVPKRDAAYAIMALFPEAKRGEKFSYWLTGIEELNGCFGDSHCDVNVYLIPKGEMNGAPTPFSH